MSYSLQQLQAMPLEQLELEHDATAAHTVVGVDYYLGEIRRRQMKAVAAERLRRMNPTEPAPVKRCWVLEDGGRQPGLLLEWRRTPAGWQGRVVHPVRQAAGWVVVEDWITADLLEADRF